LGISVIVGRVNKHMDVSSLYIETKGNLNFLLGVIVLKLKEILLSGVHSPDFRQIAMSRQQGKRAPNGPHALIMDERIGLAAVYPFSLAPTEPRWYKTIWFGSMTMTRQPPQRP